MSRRNSKSTASYRAYFEQLFSEAIDQELKKTNAAYKPHKVIRDVKLYFLEHPDFESAKTVLNTPSLKKGLLIYGKHGVGKSLLLNTIQKMGHYMYSQRINPFLYFSVRTAPWFIEQYQEAAKQPGHTFKLEEYTKGKLYIDDLGMERPAFGSQDIIGDLLFDRHRNQVKTYVTTNLTPSEIADRYGDRIGDRLPEMFNIIRWDGQSLRSE